MLVTLNIPYEEAVKRLKGDNAPVYLKRMYGKTFMFAKSNANIEEVEHYIYGLMHEID